MAVASRMIWGSGSVVRTFTGASGKVYTYAPVLDVLSADVAAGVTAGLTTLCQSGAVAQGAGTIPASVGNIGGYDAIPPGGQAGLPTPQPYPDPNRPAQPIAVGTFYIDAALQRLIVSTGTNWIDPMTGSQV